MRLKRIWWRKEAGHRRIHTKYKANCVGQQADQWLPVSEWINCKRAEEAFGIDRNTVSWLWWCFHECMWEPKLSELYAVRWIYFMLIIPPKIDKEKSPWYHKYCGSPLFCVLPPEVWVYFNRFASIVPGTVGLCTWTKRIRLYVYFNIFIWNFKLCNSRTLFNALSLIVWKR